MNEKEIEILEEFSAELYKEILLNDVAIFEAEKLLNNSEKEFFSDEEYQRKHYEINMFIERLKQKNVEHKKQIVANEYEIKKLKEK